MEHGRPDGRWYPSHLYPEYRPAPPSEAPAVEGAASGHSADEESVERSAIAVAAAQHCANGHEMAEPQAFCSVCGSKRNDETNTSVSLDPQVVTATCANGHVMEASHAYCSVCGGARNAGPRKSNVNRHSTDRPTAPSGLSPTARASLFAVIGVVAVIIIIIILVVTLGGGGESQSYKDGYAAGQSQLAAESRICMSPGNQAITAGALCQEDVVGAPNGDNQSQWIQGCEAATGNG